MGITRFAPEHKHGCQETIHDIKGLFTKISRLISNTINYYYDRAN